MLVAVSIVFWAVVAYIAFRPHTVQVPAMGPVEIHRSRRDGASVPPAPAQARVIVERAPLAGRRPLTPLTGRAARPALPPGAMPMGGQVGAIPMPSRFE